MLAKFAFAVLALVLLRTPSLACSEPDAPSCASDYGEFEDQYEFDDCRREMESYQSDVESFVSCRENEIEDRTNEIEDRTNEIERLNSEIYDLNNEIDEFQIQSRRVLSDYEGAVSSFNNRLR